MLFTYDIALQRVVMDTGYITNTNTQKDPFAIYDLN